MERKPVIKDNGIDGFIHGAKDEQMHNQDGNVSRNNSGNKNVSNDGNIVIIKPIVEEESKRVSYYLKQSTIDKIKQLADDTDMKISPWLQKFLEENLDKVKIT